MIRTAIVAGKKCKQMQNQKFKNQTILNIVL